MRVELAIMVAVAVGCGPAHVLTRPQGDGGWSAERRQDEVAARATAARVDLAAEPLVAGDLASPIGLEEVLRLASAENRRVVEADRDVAIAGERVAEARGRLFPSVTGQGRYTWYSDAQTNSIVLPAKTIAALGGQAPVVTIREPELGTASGVVTVPIDVFGEITKGLTAAQAGYRAEEARRFATLLAEQVAAVRSYFALLEAQRLHAVAEQTLAAQRQQLDNAQSRVDAGRLTRNELLVVQVAVRNTEQRLRNLDLLTAQARWALNGTIGRPIDAPTRIDDVIDRPELPSVGDALREAYAHNPVLLALVEEQQRLEDTTSAISRSRLPQVQGGGAIDYTSSQVVTPQRIESGFLGLTWNFDLGGRKQAQVDQARLAAEQNHTRIERSLREVEAAVRATRQAVEERLASLESAETAVRQADENLRIRVQQFDVGRATSEDVLDAQSLLAQQRAVLASALYQAHARRAELQQVMGLPIDAIRPGPR